MKTKIKEALFIADANVFVSNGNLARQLQFIRKLSNNYKVSILNTGASPKNTINWLKENNIDANVLSGAKVFIIWLYVRFWYYFNTLFCNKLRLIDNFIFPFKLHLGISNNKYFHMLVFFYAWVPLLINVKNQAGRSIVDLNDIMANRHLRIKKRRWISFSSKDEKEVISSSQFEPIAITKEDAIEIRNLYNKEVEILPYSIDFAKKKTAQQGKYVGFLGAKNNFSEDFIDLLVSSSLIETLAERQVKLLIAGNICDYINSNELKSLKSRGVSVIGSIDSIKEFYDKVHTVINLSGPSTGAKIKSIEALMYGKKLISTEFGVDEYTNKYFMKLVYRVAWPLSIEEIIAAILKSSEENVDNTSAAIEAYDNFVNNKFINLLR